MLRYNFLPTAGSPLGVKRSDETKAKMSESITGDKNPMYGKVSGVAQAVYLYSIDSTLIREFNY
jgi:hypothetical protein